LRVSLNENVIELFIISKIQPFSIASRGQGSAVKTAQCGKILAKGKG